MDQRRISGLLVERSYEKNTDWLQIGEKGVVKRRKKIKFFFLFIQRIRTFAYYQWDRKERKREKHSTDVSKSIYSYR